MSYFVTQLAQRLKKCLSFSPILFKNSINTHIGLLRGTKIKVNYYIRILKHQVQFQCKNRNKLSKSVLFALKQIKRRLLDKKKFQQCWYFSSRDNISCRDKNILHTENRDIFKIKCHKQIKSVQQNDSTKCELIQVGVWTCVRKV